MLLERGNLTCVITVDSRMERLNGNTYKYFISVVQFCISMLPNDNADPKIWV